jgi:pyrrolidone-carboxylate peptidase
VAPIVGGEAQTTTETVIAGVPIKLPMVDVHMVSAGGGSIAWADAGGALRVGPQSAGAEPGPAALFSMLPYRRIVGNLRAGGIPAFVSNTAGTYICNNTLYGLLDHIRKNDLPMVAGFVHFPASTEMAVEDPSMPSLPMEMMVEALQRILETVAEEAQERDEGTATARSANR